MCRFILYLGPSITLSSLVTEPEHGLLQQSIKAHDPVSSLNADGFGVAWYVPEITKIPAVFKDITPAWSNMNLKQMAKVTRSHCIFSHVRAASTGPVVQTNCHPFTYRNLSFMHNGTVAYFSKIRRKMMLQVSEQAFTIIQGSTDSEVIFAMFVTNFEKLIEEERENEGHKEGQNKDKEEQEDDISQQPYFDGGEMDYTQLLTTALRTTLHQVHRIILEHEAKEDRGRATTDSLESEEFMDGASLPHTKAIARLNLAVTDGKSVVASRYSCADPSTAHTLYWCRGQRIVCSKGECRVFKEAGDGDVPGGINGSRINTLANGGKVRSGSMDTNGMSRSNMVIVSSEPLDNRQYDCERVPANHMVIAGPYGLFDVVPV